MFSQNILYRYNDQALSFIWDLGKFRGINFLPLVDPMLRDRGVDMLFSMSKSWLAGFISPIALNNLLALSSLILTFYFSYKLFVYVTSNHKVGVTFAIFNSLSLYFLYRVISATQGLYLTFVFPLGLGLLMRRKHPVLLAGLVLTLFGIVSYYAYFLAVLVLFWYIAEFIVKELSFKQLVVKAASFGAVVFLGFLVFFPKIFLSNTPIFNSGYSESDTQEVVYRPLEDWYNFSFRPWYFFIPPESSVFFGDLSDKLLRGIEGTGYYLADDYEGDEMSGAYMGWHWLVGLGVLLYLKRPLSREQKKIFLTLIGVLAISFPPSFTIAGYEIFTPSFILYQIVPVFRVLVRWSVVVYLLILLLNSYLFVNAGFKKLFFLFLLSLGVFLVRVPIINSSAPPPEIAFLTNLPDEPTSVLIYPSGDFYSVFWVLSHEIPILNPSITPDLDTLSQRILFKKEPHEVDYIVVYFDRISDRGLLQILAYNSDIKSKEDLDMFIKDMWGERVYRDSQVSIYSVKR